MEQIMNQLVSNIDFSFMLVINMATYFTIKIIDELNGDKTLNTWIKRIVFLINALIFAALYVVFTKITPNVIINSVIIAPISWSWIFKPLFKKFGVDYKK